MWDELSDFVAKLLTRFPFLSILASLIVCVFFSSGLYNVHFEQDIRRSFSPQDSQTAIETRNYLQFHNLSVFPRRAFVVFNAIDGGDLFRDEQVEEILRFDKLIKKFLYLGEEDTACHPLCFLNSPFHAVLKQMQKPTLQDETTIGFPVTKIKSTPLFLGLHLGETNVREQSNRTWIEAKTVVLWYFTRADTEARRNAYLDTTLSFFEMSKNHSFSPIINFTIFGDEIANHEMVRGALEATALMSIGFVFLFVFVIFVVGKQSKRKFVVFLVTATILTPFLATAAAFGLLAWLHYPIYSMQCVTPFLVLGIGVDDAFILMYRWQAHGKIRDHASRLRKVIVDVGPSITITSVTNMIAFGVGFFTPTPQMSLFCLSTSLALLFDYIFTYTILTPVVYLCSDDNEYNTVNTNTQKKNTFYNKYSSLLTSFYGRLLCLLFLSSLYVFSSFGVFTMKSTFEPAKAFPSNSPLLTALKGIRPVMDIFFPVNIYVNRPPVINNKDEYDAFYNMISLLEAIPGAYGRNRTLLFLTPYEEFDRKISSWTSSLFLSSDSYSPSLKNLPFWLDQVGNPTTIRYQRENMTAEPRLTSFQFSLLGNGMAEWANRAQFVQSVRTTLHKYPQFNASLFDGDSAVLGIILTVRNDLIGSIALTVACMALVCLCFVTSKRGVAVITFTITSICYTLVGCLSWWGSDLDPVTQVDVLLATGFSVDYTAHVAYKFYRSVGSATSRVEASLEEMAAPMVQAGLSTFLCMLPLIFVPTYAIVAFAKTIFLVVGIGLIHGLFVLPVLLAATVSSKRPQQETTPVDKPETLFSLNNVDE